MVSGGPSEALVDQAAFNYLNRFDSSVQNLRQVLRRQLRRRLERVEGGELPAATYRTLDDWIERVLVRFQASGLLDDRRYARNLAGQLRRRGSSARAISMKLRKKGVNEEQIDEVLSAEQEQEVGNGLGPELEAAVAYARRRRLGTFRKTETTRERHQKDLAALARQGFSFRVAESALSTTLQLDDHRGW